MKTLQELLNKPFFLPQASSNNDKSETDDNEVTKKEDGENNTSTTSGWTGYNGSGSAVTGHLAGLLGQNGQNGSSSVRFTITNLPALAKFTFNSFFLLVL